MSFQYVIALSVIVFIHNALWILYYVLPVDTADRKYVPGACCWPLTAASASLCVRVCVLLPTRAAVLCARLDLTAPSDLPAACCLLPPQACGGCSTPSSTPRT